MVRLARRQLWQGPTAQTVKIRQRHQTATRLVAAERATAARLPESVLPSWLVQSDTDREEAEAIRGGATPPALSRVRV